MSCFIGPKLLFIYLLYKSKNSSTQKKKKEEEEEEVTLIQTINSLKEYIFVSIEWMDI